MKKSQLIPVPRNNTQNIRYNCFDSRRTKFLKLLLTEKDCTPKMGNHQQCFTPQVQRSYEHDSPSFKPRYCKHKNFYQKSNNLNQSLHTPSQVKAQEVLNKICFIKQKILSEHRPESKFNKRKGFSIDCSAIIKPIYLGQSRKSQNRNINKQCFTPCPVIDKTDWLEFIFDYD